MFPRDQFVKAPARATFGFGRGPSATASADHGSGYDEIVVQRILAVGLQQRPRTMGEFGQLARPYFKAGYQREVAEAHRRYFSGSSRH